jgi:hypothetical protein
VPKTSVVTSGDEDADHEPARETTEKPDQIVRLLLHSALVDMEARQWLAAQDVAKTLAGRPGIGILGTCLQATFDPADAGATQAFVATQTGAAQSVLAALLLGRAPSNPVAIARDSLNSLRRRDLESRREAVTARLRAAGLPPDEVARLQREVVDIMQEIGQVSGSH